MSRRRWLRLTTTTAAAAVAVVLAGCSSGGDQADDGPTTSPSVDGPAPDLPSVAVVQRAAPWPNRPVVDLRFDASRGLETIRGTERVRFVAEERVCQLVFRL